MKKIIIILLILGVFIAPVLAEAGQYDDSITDTKLKLAQFQASLSTVELNNSIKDMKLDMDRIAFIQECELTIVVVGFAAGVVVMIMSAHR